MPQPEDPVYETWTVKDRIVEAGRLVCEEGMSAAAACRKTGIDRPNFVKKHLPRFREQYGVKLQKAEEELRLRASGALAVKNEERRVPPFAEWERIYFGHIPCGDCGVRHEMPDFHREIITHTQDPQAARVLVNLPPYHSKSTLVTLKETAYEICKNPNSRHIIVSKSLPFARTFINALGQLLTNNELYEGATRNLIDDYGPFRDQGVEWSQTQFYVAGRVSAEKDPTVLALGLEGQIYGRRADRIVVDDAATLENQRNPERVAAQLEWIDKELLSRIGKTGKAIFIGTRVSPGDIYSYLAQRNGWRVVRYPCIIDDHDQQVLWPEHFPYEAAILKRDEMRTQDWQLVYQNADFAGYGASFTPEMLDAVKDPSRLVGDFDPHWRLIVGVDPAGAGKDSGYTALTLIGYDPATGIRYLIDQIAHKAMKAPQLKDQLLRWAADYPLTEIRVEANAVQSQIVQYDRELVRQLAEQGIRVTPHVTTGKNKWDAEFGVDAMAPLFTNQMVNIPWGNAQSAQRFQPFVEELLAFPLGQTSDRVMSFWFAMLAAKETAERPHLPLFDQRMRVPARIRRRRSVVDFHEGRIRRLTEHELRPGANVDVGVARRIGVGRPMMLTDVRSDMGAPPHRPRYENLEER